MSHAKGVDDRVDRLLDTIAHLSDAELVMVRAIWETGDPTLRQQAWAKARAYLRRHPGDKQIDQAEAALTRWINNVGVGSRGIGGLSGSTFSSGLDASGVRQRAVPPILDAVVAFAAESVLTDEERDALLDPLRQVSDRRKRSD